MHAAVVFIHGSGKQTRNIRWAERFADDSTTWRTAVNRVAIRDRHPSMRDLSGNGAGDAVLDVAPRFRIRGRVPRGL